MGNLRAYLSIADFIKINFLKKNLKNLPSVSNSLKPNKMSGLISVHIVSWLWEKGPWLKLGKNDQLNVKFGEIYDVEYNKGSKICPQNQVILDCIMPSIRLKHKCLSTIHHSDMGHCFS